MPRPRKRSESGFYHVVPKGCSGITIFQNDEQRKVFIELFRAVKDLHDLKNHVWCLMGTHAHFIIEDRHNRLSNAMYDLLFRYARYFNRELSRTGAVFEDRFWSEPIDNDAYLLCAMNYIHNNPAVAQIAPASDYAWSSFHAYETGDTDNGFTETGLLLGMLGGNKGFLNYSLHNPPTALAFPHSKLRHHHTRTEWMELARQILGDDAMAGMKRLSDGERSVFAFDLAKSGFMQYQIEQITGLSHYRVGRICRELRN